MFTIRRTSLLQCLSTVALMAALGCTGQVGAAPSGTGGVGVTCSAGQMMCASSCTSVASDSRNCGACGNACAIGQMCTSGQCVCSGGLLACGGQCVASNAAHCGSCDAVCGADQGCLNGSCGSCPAGEASMHGRRVCLADRGHRAPLRRLHALPSGRDLQRRHLHLRTEPDDVRLARDVRRLTTSVQHCGGCNQPWNGTCTGGVCMGGRAEWVAAVDRRPARRFLRFSGACGAFRRSSGGTPSRTSLDCPRRPRSATWAARRSSRSSATRRWG